MWRFKYTAKMTPLRVRNKGQINANRHKTLKTEIHKKSNIIVH